ncbi:hypothetical protein EIO_1220 [Ketogulonicigenium vulgare Y25]|uniref:Uncharacterized protein n=1 Tax=Ketogulonicigenium vulgare (strain WSH-001) TaxID=759362 RepID=F9Y4K1_KETVW|nr:hypothetical protein EIO_1220 [Ketogulonicigenium vulgare Y25]AEM40558.1 hypothetical protein KVU_0718 [Ketogulonicigenium vulgare WSH-001]ALJ80743.1 hypothetical protein KVH_05825 [Ketogulonicigenium vulgare]AOZ54275.1 hypothetical protein KVC_1258 [Ketogulonicigenium vulgare]
MSNPISLSSFLSNARLPPACGLFGATYPQLDRPTVAARVFVFILSLSLSLWWWTVRDCLRLSRSVFVCLRLSMWTHTIDCSFV